MIGTLPHPATRQRLEPRTRPIRVCFLIDELNLAGTESQLLALIRLLDRRKVKPYLALLKSEPGSRTREVDCPVLGLGARKLCRPATALQAWRFARFLREERIDVLQLYMPDSTYFGAPAGRLARVPHVIRVRNNLNHWMTRTDRWLGRVYNRFVDLTLTNCEAAKNAVLKDERPDPNTVHVLENGVDLERFLDIAAPKRRSSAEAAQVGVVANLRRVKGLDVFVDAVRIVAARFSDVTFHIAGEGEEREALQRQIAQRGLTGRIELHGRVQNIPAFLAMLDVAVLPSRSEGMSNAILEYMAAGRAIVATAVGAAPHLLQRGLHGLLVPPENPAALADAIVATLTDPEAAAKLAASARRRAQRQFSRQAMVDRFERFYANLVPTWSATSAGDPSP